MAPPDLTLELRAATCLHWLRTEHGGVLARTGHRRRKKGEQPLPAFIALVSDGICLAEVLVRLDALPHAAVLRTAKRPASTPDGTQASDPRETARLYKQNTRRAVKALTRILEVLLGAKLPPGAMEKYFGADVATTRPSKNPLPAVKLVELLITAAMYSPESDRYVWNIWHLPCKTTKDVLQATVSAVADFFHLIPFDDVLGRSTSSSSENMGSRKISLVTDDGKPQSDLPLETAASTSVADPVLLVHPDHHDAAQLADVADDDPEVLSKKFAYQEANARLQEVARARALVSRLEGSVLGARGMYTKHDGAKAAVGPSQPPPDLHVPSYGPLPTFTSFEPRASVEMVCDSPRELAQPPSVSLPALDDLPTQNVSTHRDLSFPLDGLGPVENVISDEDKAQTAANGDEPDAESAQSESVRESPRDSPIFSPVAPQDVVPPADEPAAAEPSEEEDDEAVEDPETVEFTGSYDFSQMQQCGVVPSTEAAEDPETVVFDGSADNPQIKCGTAPTEQADGAEMDLFSSAVTLPSGSTDGLTRSSQVLRVEPLAVPSDAMNRFSGMVDASPIAEDSPLPTVPQPSEESQAVQNTSPQLPPLFRSHDQVREDNLNRAAAGERQSIIAKPPVSSGPMFSPTVTQVGPDAVSRRSSASEPFSPRSSIMPEAFVEESQKQSDDQAASERKSPVAKFEDFESFAKEPEKQENLGSLIGTQAQEPISDSVAKQAQLTSGSERSIPRPATPATPATPLWPTSATRAEYVPGKVSGALSAGKVPDTPPSPPAISDFVGRFAVRSPDRLKGNTPRVVSTMSPSPKLFQKLISVWQTSSDQENNAQESEPVPADDEPAPPIDDSPSTDEVPPTTDDVDVDEPQAADDNMRSTAVEANLGADTRDIDDMGLGNLVDAHIPEEETSPEGDTVTDAKELLSSESAEEKPEEESTGRRRLGMRMVTSPLRSLPVKQDESETVTADESGAEIPGRFEDAQEDLEVTCRRSSGTESGPGSDMLGTPLQHNVEEPLSPKSQEELPSAVRASTGLTTTTLATPPTSEFTASTISYKRKAISSKSTVCTDTQGKRKSRESQSSMSPAPTANAGRSSPGGVTLVDDDSVRVDKRRLDWLTRELLAARDVINKKDLEKHLSEKEIAEEKEVLILQKQDAESVVAAMKQILAERESELREARKRLSMAITGGSSKRASTRGGSIATRGDVFRGGQARVASQDAVKADTESDFAKLFNRFEQSDAATKEVVSKSHEEMNRLWGEVQTSMEEKMDQMIDRRDRELAELKIELQERQRVVDQLQEDRLNLVNQNAAVQAEADSAKQERELIITQAAMEISQVQAQLVLVDKFSKKLHDTFKETELLRSQVADSQATMAALAVNDRSNAGEAKQLREALHKAQEEADRWKDEAEAARLEKIEAERKMEELSRQNEEQPREYMVARGDRDDAGSYSSDRPSNAERYGRPSNAERYGRPSDADRGGMHHHHHVQQPIIATPSFHRDTMPEDEGEGIAARSSPEEGGPKRMWRSIKNLVTGQKASGRKPPRKPRERRGARSPPAPPAPVEEEDEEHIVGNAPYRSPQLSPRDFVTSYRYGTGRVPSPPLSDHSRNSRDYEAEVEGSAESPVIRDHDGLRQVSF